jgi:hypothetical protein
MTKIMKIVTIIFVFLISYNVSGQKFIDQIRIGEKIPSKINVGGFTEQNSDNCNCRTFAIEYDYDLRDPYVVQSLKAQKDAKLATVISLHYDLENTIVGIIKIEMNIDENKTADFFISDFEYDMKLTKQFEDFEFIESNLNSDLKYYSVKIKNYETDGLDVIRTKGIIKNSFIEETYLPNSSYDPRYKLSNNNLEQNINSEPLELAISFGDLDKDEIEEKVVVFDTGIELEGGTKREIYIYKKSNGNWKLWHTSQGSIVPGGLMLASFENLSIERGCIVIRHFGGSNNNKWFYVHRFRYQNNDWELIGATIKSFSTCGISETADYNFSTGKMIFESESNNCDEQSNLKEKTVTEFRKRLSNLPKMDGFKVGENLIRFPNSERQFYF